MIKQTEKIGGQVHVYTGNGKGKTTSALGLAMRAVGSGMKVYIAQFMKGQEYSEIKTMHSMNGIEVEQFGWKNCIRKEDVDFSHKSTTIEGFRKCRRKALSGEYSLVILDEIIVSVWFGLLEEQMLIDLIKEIPDNCELVLTGRYASKKIIGMADLVTEMKCTKHYYEKGVLSRKGIEY